MKKPTEWAFDYLPASFGVAGFGALFLVAVTGAVTVTLVFGATAGAASALILFFDFVAGCVMIIFLMSLLLNDQMHLLLLVV